MSYVSICLFDYLFIEVSIQLGIYLFIYTFIYLFFYVLTYVSAKFIQFVYLFRFVWRPIHGPPPTAQIFAQHNCANHQNNCTSHQNNCTYRQNNCTNRVCAVILPVCTVILPVCTVILSKDLCCGWWAHRVCVDFVPIHATDKKIVFTYEY